MAHVSDLDIMGGSTPIQVQIAGPILVEKVISTRQFEDYVAYLGSYEASEPKGFNATIIRMADIRVSGNLPSKIPVSGALQIEADRSKPVILGFKGAFFPTTYVREAWDARDDTSAGSRRRYF